MQWDDNAEIRAMILTALPFPPIPILCRGMSDEDSVLGDEKSITTHDIISKLMENAVNIKDENVHEARRERQQQVLKEFMRELLAACGDHEVHPPELYEIYCKYTIKHIETYFAPGASVPINLLHYETVQGKDKVHAKTCDYMAGQAVLLGLQPDRKEAWANTPYFMMLMEAKNRLITEPIEQT